MKHPSPANREMNGQSPTVEFREAVQRAARFADPAQAVTDVLDLLKAGRIRSSCRLFRRLDIGGRPYKTERGGLLSGLHWRDARDLEWQNGPCAFSFREALPDEVCELVRDTKLPSTVSDLLIEHGIPIDAAYLMVYKTSRRISPSEPVFTDDPNEFAQLCMHQHIAHYKSTSAWVNLLIRAVGVDLSQKDVDDIWGSADCLFDKGGNPANLPDFVAPVQKSHAPSQKSAILDAYSQDFGDEADPFAPANGTREWCKNLQRKIGGKLESIERAVRVHRSALRQSTGRPLIKRTTG